MAKYKPIERGQGYFLTIYPEEIFDNNSLEKAIDKFINEYVDTKPFDKKYKNDTVGQKAIAPSAKLKVILYGLSQGIESMRKIEKMLNLNHPGFLFLSGGRSIDYSTLCRFLNDFPDEVPVIFARLLYILEELNLIDWRRIMIDGTKISSNASKEFTRDKEGFDKKLKHYENLSAKLLARAKYVSELRDKDEISEEELSKEKELIEKQKKKYDQIMMKIKSYEDEVKAESTSPETKVNLTDRESKLLRKEESYIQGYNVQAAFCSNDILLSIEATSKESDISLLSAMVEKVEAAKKSNDVRHDSEYLLDKGYFNISQMSELIQEGKDLYIAPPAHFTENWFINGEHQVHVEEDGVYFFCKGERKKKGRLEKSDNKYKFTLSRDFCKDCENFSSCWKDKDDNKSRVFTISKTYVDNKELWFNYRDRMQQEEWKYVYNRRIGKEHNFFDLKSNNGLSRLNWRGRKKCNTISIMAGIAYNLKKFQKAVADIGWDGVKSAMA
jgi:transposase